MNTDPIADLLTRIRNAVKAKQQKTVAPHSKLKVSILEVMKKNGFIDGFKVVKNERSFDEIQIDLSTKGLSLSLKRVSKPGQRIYVKKGDIKPVIQGYGISIFSTPRGVMTGHEAFKAGIGGEYLCKVW